MTKPSLNLTGVFTALVTPYTPDGSAVDFDALEKLVERQIQMGVDGLVPVGTTGECPTLSHDEHDKVIETVVRVAAKRVPVIAGTGSNATAEAIRLTQNAKECGADAALIVNPYYNKPGQEGLKRHFKAIAAVGLPIVLYNIPGRTNINMTPQTVAELYREIPEIIAIKEATGSIDQATEIASLCEIQILSGDDSLTSALMSVGARGVISVASNLDPQIVQEIVKPMLAGDVIASKKALHKRFTLFKALFCEANPQPCKWAMHLMKLCSPALRLPLVELSEENRPKVEQELVKNGLL